MDLDLVGFKWSPETVNNNSNHLHSSYYIRQYFRHRLSTSFALIYKHFSLKANVESHYSLAKRLENIITEVEVE